jgi:hypothetical protein
MDRTRESARTEGAEAGPVTKKKQMQVSNGRRSCPFLQRNWIMGLAFLLISAATWAAELRALATIDMPGPAGKMGRDGFCPLVGN